MFDFVIKNIKKHFSLIIIVFGGACFLVSNVLLKEILDDKDYGFYSIVTTYLSLIFIYGLLGFEQVFLRFSFQKEQYVISTQKAQLFFISIIVLSTTLFSFTVFNVFYNDSNVNIILLFGATFCCIFTLFLFNVFRLNKNYVLAQITSNSWKIVLVFITLFFLWTHNKNVDSFLNILLGTIVLVTIFVTVYLIKKIKFEFNNGLNNKDLFHSFVHFFIAITSFSLLLFGDRFLIENKVGIVSFGDYFYLTNIVLAPFSILQNYVGFKQLVAFKDKLNREIFIAFNKKISTLALVLSLFIVLFLIVIIKINVLSFDFKAHFSTIGLLLILGMVRLYSSGILAAFEARTNINNLKKTNIIVVLFTLLIFIILIYACSTINQIIIGFILIWLIRSLILRKFLIHQIVNDQ